MEASVASLPAVFVGRVPELRSLRAALDETLNVRGRLVLLVGEPGIGKTRTAAEFAEHARRAGACVLWGGCYDGEWAPPFGPFAEAIAAYARQADPDTLRDDLGFGAAPIARVIPAVRERLPDLPEPSALQPDEEHFRLLDAVSQFLIATAKHTPVVVVLDDLHWADKGTLAMLRHVARFAPQHRLLVLGAYRDVELDAQHPLTDALGALYRETTCERISLRGLDEPEVAQLVADSDVPIEKRDALAATISAATNGNPFFVREVLHHWDEAGQFADGLRARSPASIPDSVRHVLHRRVRRLSAETARLLSVAAACGGPFHLGVAAQVAGLDEVAALNSIDEALRAQLVRPADSAERYDFTHALIRETLYSARSPSRQARLHRQIAEAMEQVYGERVAEHAAEIAQQYYRSKDLPGAARGVLHALAAVGRAETAYARDEEATFLRLALDLLPGNDLQQPRLCGRLGLALAWTLSFDEALRVASEAARLIAAAEGKDAAADYLAQVIIPMWTGGFFRGAFNLAQEGLRYVGTRRDATWASLKALDIIRDEMEAPGGPGIPLDTPARREVSRVFREVGYDREHTPHHAVTFFTFSSQDEVPAGWFWALGKYRHGVSMFSKWAVENEAQGRVAEAVGNWAAAFRFHTALGEFVLAREARRRGAALAGRLLAPSILTSRLVAGEGEWRMALDQGWDEPVGHLGPGVVLTWHRGAMYASVALIHARMGRTDRAVRRLASVIPALEKGACWGENYVLIACDAAETLWLTGRRDHSETIERNLRAKVIGPDLHHPMRDGRLALARLCALQGRYDEAVEWFAKARTVLDEQGARPLRAIVDYDEGLMYMRRGEAGDAERAAPLLDIALRQFRTLGMPGWIRRAESLLHGGVEWQPAAQPQAGAQDERGETTLVTDGRRAMDDERKAERTPGAEPAPPDANVFRQEGHFWTIVYAGSLVRLKDTKGLQYLAHLLRHPGQEFLALDLVMDRGSGVEEESLRARLTSTDTAPLLDAHAKAEYRARLQELREELAEAEGFNDLGRMERLRTEVDFIGAQLSAAVGLHGKDRKVGTSAERARLMVTKRIKDALKTIGTIHPSLAHHLRACVKTGYVCAYTPPPREPVVWKP